MSKFKFKLQKLLDIKIKDEEESKLTYTQAQNKKRVVEENLKNLESNYTKYSDISKAKDVVTQKITINYLSALTQTIKVTNKELEKEEVKVNEAKEDFIEKQIKRKSLEKLKENALEKLRKEEERIEQITNDEFALYAYMRNIANIS
ncbi:flagellar export protein FliJ [Romboutsia sp.]|uniref:flagellar export protein FliJ n=1 Tax=Romboutsia sp. TaxID=1965302 RepID=UPI002BC34ACF|nr:flagellar export protein FliJ [Romboutsia sp.]HSQ87849.1 flagellar export protein FliJ [Romboutsia sp.]